MFNLEGTQLGNGYWTKIETCNEAMSVVKSGYVCAPQNGSVIVVDVFNGSAIGGYYSSLASCQGNL